MHQPNEDDESRSKTKEINLFRIESIKLCYHFFLSQIACGQSYMKQFRKSSNF